MPTAELLTTIRDALAGDAALVAWCQTTFSATPVIQIDFDDQQDIEEFPLIALVQIGQEDGLMSPRKIWTINGTVFVRNTARAAATVNGCKTLTYTGRLEAEGLREQTVAALYRARIGKITVQGDAMSHTFHPKYVSPFIFTIETIGDLGV